MTRTRQGKKTTRVCMENGEAHMPCRKKNTPDFRGMQAILQPIVGEFWFGNEKLQELLALLADKEDTYYDSSSGDDIASPASNGTSIIDGSTKRQADGGEQSPPSKAQRVSFSPEGGGASDDGASVNTESAV